MEQKQFTKAELARFNGQNGMPCYIAFDGKVYDVSDSTMWEDGNHQGVHDAGMDLTRDMDDAPHSAKVLYAFPIVGELVG
ncbi:MAG: cytochrome b5 domain-containing protein [Bacteroidota bacterium]|nr:cytochrome b5 domain-containing protein [Bacteroidota bacterium]